MEKLLVDMRAEMERSIRSNNPNASRDCRAAWYWSYIGSVDMARQLGLIAEQHRQELYAEAKELKKLAHEYHGVQAVGEGGDTRPNGDKASSMDKYSAYLTRLRDSSVTNMFGAIPYLQKSFPELAADDEQAKKVLTAWMDSFPDSGNES